MEEAKATLAHKFIIIPTILFIFFTGWFLYLHVVHADPESTSAQVWAASYQIVALVGAFYGLYYSRIWGGWKSVLGRANIMFAIGLFLQAFGQSVFSYFFYIGVEAPYPSLADAGFFGSIFFYIYAIVLLSRAMGVHDSLKSFSKKVVYLLLPIALLIMTYVLFLKDYSVDPSSPLTTFLDFGYPIGQVIYVALAVSAYISSRNFLGGVMRKPIVLFIAALVVQYVADFVFLLQTSNGTYTGSQNVDYIYFLAYFLMTISLIRLGSVFYKIRNA